MFTPVLSDEWLELLMPPSAQDFLHHPRQAFFKLLLASLVADLWEACFGHLNNLIKARLCNSSSSTSATPMARDQAGIHRWTSKIGIICRNGLLFLLSLLRHGVWIWTLLSSFSQGGTRYFIPFSFINAGIEMTAMLMGPIFIILEKIFKWLWRQLTRRLKERGTAGVQAGTPELRRAHSFPQTKLRMREDWRGLRGIEIRRRLNLSQFPSTSMDSMV